MHIKFRVLFVCMGNICRSPAGEAIFRRFIAARGFSHCIEVDSAGTIAYHQGEPADERMRLAAATRGYQLNSRARQVQREDLDTFDLVIAMDHKNLDDLARLDGGGATIRLLGSFLPECQESTSVLDVPDPYYGGNAGFENVIDMIERACPTMLKLCEGQFAQSK